MKVEIAFALPHQQIILPLEAPENCTVEKAVDASGILERFPEIDLSKNKVGIFGKLVKLDTLLGEGDRVEIYRPLIIDPKQARRQRAVAAKK